MAVFKVKLGSSDGAVLFRETRGTSTAEVKARFQHEGYFVFSVKRAFEPGNLLGIRQRVPVKPFVLFNKELRSLIKAGLPIVEGLDLLLGRMRNKKLAELIARVREQLVKGESLSEAFSAHIDRVPRYYPALLHAGEQSGNLVEVLDRFIAQEERIRKARKKFRQAMTYPAILLTAALVALYLILTRAMPEFASLYAGSQRDLPLITRIVMAASDWLNAWYLHLFIFLGIITVSLFLYLRTERGGLNGERVLRRIPVLGRLWVLQNQNIFARTMRLLLAGGLPVPRALAIVSGASPSRLLGVELEKVHGDLLQGKALQESLDRHAHLTSMAGEMIRVGEATGALDEMFEHVAEHGEEQAEDVLETVSGLIAPVMLVIIGLMIAFLVIAMYLPMFGSYDALGG